MKSARLITASPEKRYWPTAGHVNRYLYVQIHLAITWGAGMTRANPCMAWTVPSRSDYFRASMISLMRCTICLSC